MEWQKACHKTLMQPASANEHFEYIYARWQRGIILPEVAVEYGLRLKERSDTWPGRTLWGEMPCLKQVDSLTIPFNIVAG